ncbi:MAG: aldehyde ferredoxin oxidoreductase family protein [Peptococcaceae bacterium]|nr:aldehyde ferredoxin oxidoreductase family protein [Peptococcaceae bacterium]
MGTKYGGYMGKVLKIDLSARETGEYPWSDRDRELYLGGKIMAAKILSDSLAPGVDPFSPENVLVVSTGPLTGTGAPMSSRFNISTLSPLTGLLASSNCGGDFGLHLKRAGYDALVITGKSPGPVWIEINEDRVEFHSAGDLWGKTTMETQKALEGKNGKIVIGPAGENLVKYAGVFSNERTAGRAGIGAVMGSKNLKAVVASGSRRPVVADEKAAKKLYKAWSAMIRSHPITGEQLPRLGTAALVSMMNVRRILATRNFKYGYYKDFDMISGETLAEKHLIKNRGCTACPVQCGRRVEVCGKKVKGPELETLVLLGSNIENNSLERILEWNFILDELGMDTISTGGTIAFAMELNEKGLWKNGLKFGNTDNLKQVFEDIAYRRGIGDELAEGSRYLSEKYGGKEFAMQSKGLELAAYDPRRAVGQGLGYAVANRGGCHLNAGYLVLFEGLGLSIDSQTTMAKAEMNVLFQNLMEAASASGICLFSLYTSLLPVLLKKPNSLLTRMVNKSFKYTGPFLRIVNRLRSSPIPVYMPPIPHSRAVRLATGMKMDLMRFKTIGERGYNLERAFNVRRGLTAGQDSLPARLTGEPQDPCDPGSVVPLEELKKDYYSARGWDINGAPRDNTLRRLGISGGR